MAQFSVNAQRFDPYKNFNFRVEIDGLSVAGFSECTGLETEVSVIEYREGADSAVRNSSTRIDSVCSPPASSGRSSASCSRTSSRRLSRMNRRSPRRGVPANDHRRDFAL